MSDADLTAPPLSKEISSSVTAPEAALPQFDAYPLPPGRGMAAIPLNKQDALTQNVLMKDTAKDSSSPAYSDYRAGDEGKVRSFLVGDVKREDVDRYLASVNRDIRLHVANDQWDKYLKADDVSDKVRAQYKKLQETEDILKKQDGAGGELTSKLRQQIVAASGGKLREEDLKGFEQFRLAEAKRAEQVLAEHGKPAETTTQSGGQGVHHHRIHHDEEGGETEPHVRHHMRGRGNRAQGTEQGNGNGDDETTKLNKEELARLQGGANAATSGRGQEAPTQQSMEQWMQSYSAWYYSQYGNRGIQQQQYPTAGYYNNQAAAYNPSYPANYNNQSPLQYAGPAVDQTAANVSYYGPAAYNPYNQYATSYANYSPYSMQPTMSPLGNIALSLGLIGGGYRPYYSPWMYRPPVMPMFAFGGWRRPGLSLGIIL